MIYNICIFQEFEIFFELQKIPWIWLFARIACKIAQSKYFSDI